MTASLIVAMRLNGGHGQYSDDASHVSVDPVSGATYSPSHALFQRGTWETLDTGARAELYVSSAAVGLLGKDLRECARLVQPTEFQYGDVAVRGAAALADLPPSADPNLPPSVICTIGNGAILTLATVQRMLEHSLGHDARLAQELASLDTLVTTPADERALLAVLFIREAGRTSSPLMPYIQALLWRAHENIPSAWNPASQNGADRRAALGQAGGSTLLRAADALRKSIFEAYVDLVPRALEQLPGLLVDGVAADEQGVANHYSFQKFAEVWLGMRSRSFSNEAYGILVPLICLMNHPAAGEPSNVDAVFDAERGFVMTAKRPIKQGEELLYSYGESLCRERALLVYGFVLDGMPPCEGF
jgi:hypothetical protein